MYFKIFTGPLSEVLFPIDNLTKKPKGFAFVTYMIPENAVSALAQLDGHIFQVFDLLLMFEISLCSVQISIFSILYIRCIVISTFNAKR